MVLSRSEVADLIGQKYYAVKYAIDAGHVKRPAKVGGRYMFTQTDIKRLRKYFDKECNDEPRIKR